MGRISWARWSVMAILAVFLLTGQSMALEVGGKAAYLMDPYSGRVFLEQNSDQALPVASVSKLMTLILVLESVNRGEVALDDLVTASPLAASKRGSRIWLEAGEQLPLGELIYAIAVGSANDAAVAVAEFVAGSEEQFVELMNSRALEFGLSNSIFVNSTGLPEDEGSPNLMSAKDVALLAQFALEVPYLADYVSTYEYTMRSETTGIPVLWNGNKLLRRYYGVDGLKTGFTTEAGYCMAATAERDNLRLIAVTLGQEDEADRESATRALLDYGFRKYQSLQLYAKGAVVGSLNSPSGKPRLVDVVLPNDFYITAERGKEVDLLTVMELERDIPLPIRQGQVVGTITALYDDEVLGINPLTVSEAVQKLSLPALVYRLATAVAQSLF